MSCFGLIWTDACFRHGLQHDMPRFSAGRLSPSPKHHLSLVAVRILQAFITSRCHAMQLDRSSNASVFGVSGIRCKLILFVAPEGCVSANVICLSAFCTIRSFLVGCRLVTMGQSISVLGLTFDWEPDWKASIGCHFQCSWHPPGIIPGILLASSCLFIKSPPAQILCEMHGSWTHDAATRQMLHTVQIFGICSGLTGLRRAGRVDSKAR